MKTIKTICTVIAAAMLAAAVPTKNVKAAEQEKPELGLSLGSDFLSKYVFRGFAYSEDPVVQSTIAASYGNERYGNITLIGFGNFDFGLEQLTEADIMAEYGRQFGKVSAAFGYGYFTFPNTGLPDTQEVYGAASVETLLNPTITVVHDFEGTYAEAGIGHDFKLGKVPLSASAKLSYNDNHLIEDSGLSHAEATLAMPIEAGKLTITPSITRTEAISDNIESTTWGGVSVEYNF